MPGFELWNTKPFRHAPISGPRDLIGEQVMIKHWSNLMRDRDSDEYPNSALAGVMHDYCGRLDQRVATVAATFICWLGTTCGTHYLNAALRLASDTALDRPDAFLMAWARENLRRYHTSRAARPIERILAKDPNAEVVPAVSLCDIEVVEHLVMWLGGEDGQAFLTGCKAEIAGRKAEAELGSLLRDTPSLQQSQVARIMDLAKTAYSRPA